MKKNAHLCRCLLLLLTLSCLFCFLTYAASFNASPAHECTGEQCPICLCVTLHEQLLRALTVLTSLYCLFMAVIALQRLPLRSPSSLREARSPVFLKVKLSN